MGDRKGKLGGKSMGLGSFFVGEMEDPAARDAKMEQLLALQHARAAAKVADWARPTKYDGFWKHPKSNARYADNLIQHADKTPQYHMPDTGAERRQYHDSSK